MKRPKDDYESVRPEDRSRTAALVKDLLDSGRVSKVYDLEGYTAGEALYHLSLIPGSQRPYDEAQMKRVKEEILRIGWSADDGEMVKLFLDDLGNLSLIDAMHRLAALRSIFKDGKLMPPMVRLLITRDPKAYLTIGTCQKPRTVANVAHFEGRTPVSGPVGAGIRWYKDNFVFMPPRSKAAEVEIRYTDTELLEFLKKLPQSGGSLKNGHTRAGIYAMAAWLRGEGYNEEDILAFFSALMRNEQGINGRIVPELKEALATFLSHPGDLKGCPGFVFTATVSGRAFVSWMTKGSIKRNRLTGTMLKPPDGAKSWPSSMIYPLPGKKE